MTVSCFYLKQIMIEVIGVQKSCPSGYKTAHKLFFPNIVPQGLCPILYYCSLPYVRAIENDAQFNNKPEKNFIIAQCPHPRIGIAVKIAKKNHSVISIEIASKKMDCPFYPVKIGDTWELNQKKTSFCRRAYHDLFPYISGLSAQASIKDSCQETFEATCSRCTNFVIFRLTIVNHNDK